MRFSDDGLKTEAELLEAIIKWNEAKLKLDYWLCPAVQKGSAAAKLLEDILRRQDNEETKVKQSERQKQTVANDSTLPLDIPALLSASEIAKAFGVKLSALESALSRHKKKNVDCFVETDEGRKVGDPKYMYRVAEIMPVVQKLKGRTPSQK